MIVFVRTYMRIWTTELNSTAGARHGAPTNFNIGHNHCDGNSEEKEELNAVLARGSADFKCA